MFGKTYLIKSNNEMNLYFKAVVGEYDEKQNNLINTEDCSKIFELKTIKSEE